MKATMKAKQAALYALLEENELTAGMSVRVYGDHLLMGRPDTAADGGGNIENLRLTRLRSSSFGLSVRRHNGRWERTPFSGSVKDMVQVMLTFMQHLIAP
jgi:hypothetical protein